MTRKMILGTIAMMALAICCGDQSMGQVFDISWYKIAGGGGYASGGNFELDGTIGQHDAGAVMSGGRFTMSGGFWAGSVGSTVETALVNSINVELGSINSGSVVELQASDNQYLLLDPVFEQFRYQLIFTLNGVSSTQTPSGLTFNLEAKTFNLVGVVEQRIELFNYTTGQFEVVDTRPAGPTDSVTTVTPIGDPAQFVENGTGAIQARIRYQNTVPFWIFSLQNAYLPFRTRVDHAFWSITL